MKIVILTNADLGLYKFRKELLERLCAEHEVTIVLPEGTYTEDLKKTGCTFIPFEFKRRGKNPFEDFMQIRRYKELLSEIKPDVVLTYTIKPNSYGGMTCSKLHIPYIATVTGLGTAVEEGGLLSAVARTLYKRGIRNASCVFFQNERDRSFCEERGMVHGKTRVVPGSGVDTKRYPYMPYPTEGEREIRLLFVGRIMLFKGICELYEALRMLRCERNDVILDIIGDYDEDLKKETDRMVSDGLVRYHGPQADTIPFYKNAHAVVAPSWYEGMNNVLQEASSCGRPVIATRVPGCQEIFEDGITGFGCEAKDAGSLYEAIKRFADTPFKKREEMGKAAREKMKREFEREIVIEAMLEEINHAV